jgi:multisubunit Na+/H+ antiporter MnhE subunit
MATTTSRLAEMRSRAAAMATRLLVLALIWWALTGGSDSAWAWGLPAVLLAASLPTGLGAGEPWQWRIAGLSRFVPVFIWYNCRGALDVAILAMHPRRAPDPVLFSFPLRLPTTPARVFLSNLINLLPGTLSTRLDPRAVEIHVLAASPHIPATVALLERRVADLFGLTLTSNGAATDH